MCKLTAICSAGMLRSTNCRQHQVFTAPACRILCSSQACCLLVVLMSDVHLVTNSIMLLEASLQIEVGGGEVGTKSRAPVSVPPLSEVFDDRVFLGAILQ